MCSCSSNSIKSCYISKIEGVNSLENVCNKAYLSLTIKMQKKKIHQKMVERRYHMDTNLKDYCDLTTEASELGGPDSLRGKYYGGGFTDGCKFGADYGYNEGYYDGQENGYQEGRHDRHCEDAAIGAAVGGLVSGGIILGFYLYNHRKQIKGFFVKVGDKFYKLGENVSEKYKNWQLKLKSEQYEKKDLVIDDMGTYYNWGSVGRETGKRTEMKVKKESELGKRIQKLIKGNSHYESSF